jgi:hypothetical protein
LLPWLGDAFHVSYFSEKSAPGKAQSDGRKCLENNEMNLPKRAAVVTEEGPQLWAMRGRKLAFGDHVCWYCRPFRGRPRPEDWQALLDHLLDMRERWGINLLVIDPLAPFLPNRNENGTAGMLDALAPLRRLTERGLAVLLAHHPRKGEPAVGEAARGSGALAAAVDISLELTYHQRPPRRPGPAPALGGVVPL